jgi:hypothetical protein
MKNFRQLMVAALLLLPLFAWADSMLVVNMTDGSRRSFVLEDLPNVTFVEQNMVITSSTASATIERSSVSSFTFEEVPVGIESTMTTPDFGIALLGGKVSVSGCTGRVAIVAMNGAVVRQADCDASGRCQISLSGIPAGTYLVQTSVQTLKIFIR